MPYVTGMLTAPRERPVNEDRCNFVAAEGIVLWVLAVGLGGRGGGGEIASQLATDAAITSFQASPSVSRETLTACLEAANQAVRDGQDGDPGVAGIRTTAVLLAADPAQVRWAYVGDSRLYHFHDGRVVFQTMDHSGTEEGFRPTVHDRPVAVTAGDAFLLVSDGFWEYVTEREMEAELAKSEEPDDWLRGMETRLLRRAHNDHDYSAIAIFVAPDIS